VPLPENFSILHLKVAIFSALWRCCGRCFFTVQLHVLHVKSNAYGLKWLCHAYIEQKTSSHASLLYCCTNTTNHPTPFITLHIIGHN